LGLERDSYAGKAVLESGGFVDGNLDSKNCRVIKAETSQAMSKGLDQGHPAACQLFGMPDEITIVEGRLELVGDRIAHSNLSMNDERLTSADLVEVYSNIRLHLDVAHEDGRLPAPRHGHASRRPERLDGGVSPERQQFEIR
jgi:hypothetical protein